MSISVTGTISQDKDRGVERLASGLYVASNDLDGLIWTVGQCMNTKAQQLRNTRTSLRSIFFMR